jgi:nucleobase:cation symporter-1, NCS1 family
VRSGRAAFAGASIGYGLATVVMFSLGVLALAAYGSSGLDVVDALLAVPLGALAVLVLVAVELDEAFANLYSTAVSAQNVVPRADRRVLAVVVGALATTLALTFDIAAYEPFLFLIGAVFVPLVGVFAVAYALTPRGGWDTSDTARARPAFLLPWAAGFVAYQLTLPTFFAGPGAGWTAWWTARQEDLGIDPANGWSASLVGLGVAVLLTALVCLPGWLRRRRLPA